MKRTAFPYFVCQIVLVAALLVNIAGCTNAASMWNTVSGPLQPTKNQPAAPAVQLNFALPNDVRNEPIRLKSVGMANDCPMGTCKDSSSTNNNNSIFNSQ